MTEKRYYNCGKNPAMRDPTDSYRKKTSEKTGRGYYSTTVIPRYDDEGNFIGYAYNKNGE